MITVTDTHVNLKFGSSGWGVRPCWVENNKHSTRRNMPEDSNLYLRRCKVPTSRTAYNWRDFRFSRRGVIEIFLLLGCSAAYIGSHLPTFPNNL